MLLGYGWPGNVRELQSAVMHGAALASGPEVSPEDLPDDVLFSSKAVTSPGRGASEGLASLAEVERRHILDVLDACGGSQVEAARVLGIGRNTLWRKLREFSQRS